MNQPCVLNYLKKKKAKLKAKKKRQQFGILYGKFGSRKVGAS